ncbi:hypothetical protein [Undibacterium pigrum]|uniref:Uncharacterized protein n=1 Tax=Undibacterium pigrum TaxID=401470 RepID=A0A318J8R2_9BURK|nr:hypothetical protein [Undibacterium pigrum]PXX40288.1 hypothetical protein DFR42_108122 [Undibacterium pigrum]
MEKFSDQVWAWWMQDEFKKILSLCELCTGLSFLASSANDQSATIPYCPACEVWIEKILPVNDFLNEIREPSYIQLRLSLELIFHRCNSLSHDAFHCGDWNIFSNTEWEPVRAAARQALDLIGWSEFKDEKERFELDCRQKLYPHLYKT